jgi:hypothetical protein
MRLAVALVALLSLTLCFGSTPEPSTAPGLVNTALAVRVLAHKDECFLEEVGAAGTKIYMHFLVTVGGALDIDAAIYGPDAQLVWAAEKEKEARVLFKATLPGTHKFCFSNKMSTVTAKTVAFNIQVGDPAEGTKGRPIDPMERSLIKITEGLQEIRQEQNYLSVRERIHRETVESTNTRVMVWSLLEMALILGMGAGQVLYLRKSFEKRRNV